MNDLPNVIQQAAAIRRTSREQPRAGIILGTGLGGLAARVEGAVELAYEKLPGFIAATAPGHAGRLLLGRLAGCRVAVMQGRPHLYEGHAAAAVALPMRVLQALGCELLVVTSASGGLNPLLRTGDVVVLEDHINLMFRNPLIGADDPRLGPRFPDMSRPYDRGLSESALAVARHIDCRARRGVYAAVTGPNYETRAEYRLLRRMGADCVGMSTVPEVLAAVQIGLRVLGLSVVTNVFRDGGTHRTTAAEVLDDAALAEPAVEKIIEGVLEQHAGQ